MTSSDSVFSEKWRALVNTVMNTPVSIRWRGISRTPDALSASRKGTCYLKLMHVQTPHLPLSKNETMKTT